MKHLSYGDKTIFVDDPTADALVEYAGLLATAQTGDAVTVHAIGQDGNEVDVSFVLNQATNLVTETTNSHAQPPENPEALEYLRGKIDRLRNPPSVRPVDRADVIADGSMDL